jgi:hypothetical protein
LRESVLLTHVPPPSDVVMMLSCPPALGSPRTASRAPATTQTCGVSHVTSEGFQKPSGSDRRCHSDPDPSVVKATPRFSSIEVPTVMHQFAIGHVTLSSRVASVGRSDTVLQVCPPSAVLTAAPTEAFPTRFVPTARQELDVAQAIEPRFVTPDSGAVLAHSDPPSVLTAAISCPGVPKPPAPTATHKFVDGHEMTSRPALRALALTLPDAASGALGVFEARCTTEVVVS